MYFQITTRCNMRCAHCCYSCGPRGKHMPMEMVKAAIQLPDNSYITIGGGEPTLHPNFWEILGLCLSVTDDQGVFVITNGYVEETSLALLRLAEREVIGAELSLDQFHDRSMVSPRVIDGYSKNITRQSLYGRETLQHNRIRTVQHISRTGRGKHFGDSDNCVCDELIIDPSGFIYACGCKTEKFGTVWKPAIPESYFERDNKCSKRKEDF